jgi:integrase
LKDLKSSAGERDVVLIDELAKLLRRHKAASPHSQEHDYVFATATGTPMNWRNVETRGFDKAVENAKLAARETKPVLHDCRHTFASILVAQGLDVVFVSRQLGHADPSTTLRVYADLFGKANHASTMRAALSAGFGSTLETAARKPTQAQPSEITEVRPISG